MTTEIFEGPFSISTDNSKLDTALIQRFLSQDSYWAKDIPLEVVEKMIAGSLCYGVYKGDTQVGFARLITDKATFAYLADVFILPEYRGQGLSKFLMRVIMDYFESQQLRRILLGTKDAHGLYAQFGFKPLEDPSRFMGVAKPDLYTKKES
ncbi:Acetyltransferase (GNAT) domain-containing protein [Chitinophaga jiangningensis]|uniref:Acetyltransferase (GNAT) domain-containing protein n=1 Tax=Chitinophaga jiangningensis TaxID=1419482 RepID=A0A1M7CR93_9BACT|nr:GNAT family N-acetyltransferase [Chitinophaga jiangningensis]SHL69848.1 Acetyltransferase (GNAT) domain-containing protein [Chitinophaga jiangningensis]